ncbi:MAG: hypothetical protein ACX939_14850 [Hyphococcus sp.]
MGNGLANIIAAAILAFAIIWTGGFGGGRSGTEAEDYEAWLARAVGDIRNDIVINCGCCDGDGQRRAAAAPF